jgi:hypothetical protein
LTERRSSNSRAGLPPVTARSGRSRSSGRRINRSSSIRAATFASPHIRWGRAACCRAGRYVCTLCLYSEEKIMSCGVGREEASRTAHADG